MKLHSAIFSLLLLCSIRTTRARYAEITSNFNNECLRTSYMQNGQKKSSYEVKIVPCTDDSDELWNYDSKRHIMEHVLSGYCLDGRSEVNIAKCEDYENSNSKTQRWEVDDENRLVNYNPVIRPMRCMKINMGSNNLSLGACDDELNSKFTLTKPNNFYWRGMMVSKMNNKCVQSSSKNQVYIDVCRKGKSKHWSYNLKTLLIKNKATGRCIDASDYSITMSICRKNDNSQKWIRDNKGRFVNYKNDSCIGVNKETNKVKLGNCRNGDRQKFNMIS